MTAGVSVRDRSPLTLLLIWLSNASRESHVAQRVSLIFSRTAHNVDEATARLPRTQPVVYKYELGVLRQEDYK